MSATQQTEAQPEPGTLRLILTMGVAGLAAGLLLVTIYTVTKPLIEKNHYNDMQLAIKDVLDGTESTATFLLEGTELVPYDGPDGVLPEGDSIYAGFDGEGNLIGFAVPAEGQGFAGIIKVVYGFDPARRLIIGLAVLDPLLETPGLGDKIRTDPAFVSAFVSGLAIDSAEGDLEIVGITEGQRGDNEVDLISGATITSAAVVTILNDSTAKWAHILPTELSVDSEE